MDERDAPFLDLAHTDGARARVFLNGAQVASWVPAGSSDDRLFVSANARYGLGQSIRGGIPLCFPQFGGTGPLRQHGFARLQRWTLLRETQGDDGARALLQLVDSDRTRAEWPFAFSAELSVHVAAASLTVELAVHNTDTQPFDFTVALHPYFRVRDAYATVVKGLAGTQYRDALRDGDLFDETLPELRIDGEINRVYADTADTLEIVEPHRTLRIAKRGFPDAVVWNPGAVGTSSRPDFVPGDEHHMLCVEAGAITRPVVLPPGARWSGMQSMTVVSPV